MSRQEDIEKLINNHSRRLQKLKEQEASFGRLHAPAYLLTEIEDTEAEIEKLQTELKEMEDRAESTPQAKTTTLNGVHGKSQRDYSPLPPSPAPPNPKPSPPKPDILTITKPINLELVRIPAGKFLMGSDPAKDKSAGEDEQPQHRVYISEFYIGKYPVTNAQYAAFIQVTNHRSPKHWNNNQSPTGKEDHPVVNVSWDNAAAFCKWLSDESGYTVRLPTEAQWEKAARGSDGRIYAWGSEGDQNRLNSGKLWKAWASIITSAAISTTSVGHYSPRGDSPYGVADMCGNVWEWCADWFDEKEYQRRAKRTVRNPQGPTQGQGRVVRGGSWNLNLVSARCACRGMGYFRDSFDDNGGFRVALVSPS